VVERGILVASGEIIEPSALPEHVLDNPSVTFRIGSTRRPTLAEVEKTYIELTLRHVRGNQTRAAEILGISRKRFGKSGGAMDWTESSVEVRLLGGLGKKGTENGAGRARRSLRRPLGKVMQARTLLTLILVFA
jgi:hypothetical protein